MGGGGTVWLSRNGGGNVYFNAGVYCIEALQGGGKLPGRIARAGCKLLRMASEAKGGNIKKATSEGLLQGSNQILRQYIDNKGKTHAWFSKRILGLTLRALYTAEGLLYYKRQLRPLDRVILAEGCIGAAIAILTAEVCVSIASVRQADGSKKTNWFIGAQLTGKVSLSRPLPDVDFTLNILPGLLSGSWGGIIHNQNIVRQWRGRNSDLQKLLSPYSGNANAFRKSGYGEVMTPINTGGLG